MTMVEGGVETLPKISTGCVGHTKVTDDRQTDLRQNIRAERNDARVIKPVV